MTKYLIETKNLTKKFGSFTAVEGVNLKVPNGEIYGFLGPNGAGKSTTIRMLLGLIKMTSGEVNIFEKSITKNRVNILSKIGSIVESPSYYGNLTAYENLDIIRNILKQEKEQVLKALKIVGLMDAKDKLVKKYSLGMKQRLGIAQSLIGKPDLLILDEPTNGLDPAGIQEIRKLIIDLPKKMGITVLISSHILNEIELMANHIGIINKGNLLFQGPIKELQSMNKPKIKIKAEPKKGAIKKINELKYKFVENDDFITIKDDVDIAELNKELVYSGHSVFHISQEDRSLEDIFLDLTRKEA
ncbi:MAG: ABC transporter ATP-binding protein [Clostridiales bacterium]